MLAKILIFYHVKFTIIWGGELPLKKELHKNRYSILKIMQEQKPEVYNQCKYAIVD
jgi:hypothetical protein